MCSNLGSTKQELSLVVNMQFFANGRNHLNLPKQEYKQVISEINTYYDKAYSDLPTFTHDTYSEYRKGYYRYYVKNYGFDDYDIYARRKLKDGKKT